MIAEARADPRAPRVPRVPSVPRPLLVLGACLFLAALSLLQPWAPTTDPWGWIVWGRQALHGDLDTTVGNPAWKPLPVLFTTPLAVFGAAAPALWMIVERTAGLIGAVLAYRIAARAAGRTAGVFAAAALVLTLGWLRGWEHGYTEPLLVALTLGAFELHRGGHRHGALLLGGLVALGRPEAYLFVLAYAAHLLVARAGTARVVAIVAAVPTLWLGGDWWGSGDPLHAHHVATGAAQRLGHADMFWEGAVVLGPTALPVVAWAWWSRRRQARGLVALGAAALLWTTLIAVLVATGYPASARFMALPAAALAVLAGVGMADALRVARGAGRPSVRLVAGAAAVLALAGVGARAFHAPGVASQALAQAREQRALLGVLPATACGHPVLPRAQDWNAGAVAWRLGVPLERVDSALTGPHLLASRGSPVDVALRHRGAERWIGLLASARVGGDLLVPGRWRPHVMGAGVLHARVRAAGRGWESIAVCPH